jgi:hypothetical protein
MTRQLHLTTLCYDHRHTWLFVPISGHELDLSHYLETIPDHPTKDNMLVVQVRRCSTREEELATVLISARISHGQQPWPCVLGNEILVMEVAIEDAHDAGPISLQSLMLTFTERGDSYTDSSTLFVCITT